MTKLKIKSINTLKSMYDNNCIIIHTEDEQTLYLHTDEILKLINDTDRKIILNKKRKHTYIELGESSGPVKIDISGIYDMEDEELVELRDLFVDTAQSGAQVDLNDFETVIIELEERTTG